MTAVRIDGKAFAAGLRERVAEKVPAFVDAAGRKPGLAVVLVGDDPASQVYVGSKGKATIAAGMESFQHVLPATTSQDELIRRNIQPQDYLIISVGGNDVALQPLLCTVCTQGC